MKLNIYSNSIVPTILENEVLGSLTKTILHSKCFICDIFEMPLATNWMVKYQHKAHRMPYCLLSCSVQNVGIKMLIWDAFSGPWMETKIKTRQWKNNHISFVIAVIFPWNCSICFAWKYDYFGPVVQKHDPIECN